MNEDSTPDVAEDFVWFMFRVVFGPWPVMIVVGILHHDLHRDIPPLSFTQSTALALGLTVLAWFFRR